ncbi:MAG: tetratricopeptide repeat protein, partial [Myxococcota bacterium]|nr:tetratricopeptide repeat protein [Myxococcota bacterium]
YLTVLAFDLWNTQSAVSRLEGALRVNGATPAFRCAGFAHLGRFYEDQGNWVKAESYYRQALQP